MRPDPRLVALALYLVASALFLTLGARGDWGFILAFRGEKLVALTVVAGAVAISTVTFQTITGNRILTPAIMGFDALYILIQSLLVLLLGGVGLTALQGPPLFALETAVMIGAAALLFGLVLRRSEDLNRMVLTGIVLGILLRSLSSLVARVIDPSEYIYVMVNSYARFNNIESDLLWITTIVTLAISALLLARARRLDVLALGRDPAMTLGLDHRREARRLLILVTLLVAVSTALVGPVVFFGLLVSAVTHQVAGTWRHTTLLPLSALVAATVLIAAQTVFERILSLQGTVFVVIESLGGLVFILLLFRRARA
ncbi:ferric anguibactin transport system permease protein fatc [Pseudooceanicola batsensis HTCC2597]|uniref:Ferric anguibactin transport system permease protein fatc n=1 Tax=Pseudooceanicola batsensis (strain ATCC BAA-863 / DSM 15984 / KCTC 12145 / HTCC2597) TaxID=252305 RepID=A3TU89_PSEBH|nr:iron chelate uptake ABC transporter family permease subunit [Pseudooceanicola batsensis]EAQ04085.1 ferric anguibactin transport system permease protein fatc [Pseudooceanicola batsensis HTCC2597]